MKLHKSELVRVLKDIASLIEVDNSFEGSITYTAIEPDGYDVTGCYRFVNSDGQGGIRLFENVDDDQSNELK